MAEIGKDIAKAAALLAAGKLVAIPTETVYGLAANALNEEAVASIFRAKNRPFFDPLIVHISSKTEINKYAENVTAKAQKLADTFWPGPLTLVLPKKSIIPDLVTAGNTTVGLRVPKHELTQTLLQSLHFPLAAPSANPFGYVSPTKAVHVNEQLGEAVDYILDGGDCAVGLESTIIYCNEEDTKLLRLGGLALHNIEEVTGPLKENLISNSNPTAPGQLDRHYAPGCKLILHHNSEEEILEYANKKLALIRYMAPNPGYSTQNQFILSPDGNLETAARRLFAILRDLDTAGYEICLYEKVPETGLGRAINDRLQRGTIPN